MKKKNSVHYVTTKNGKTEVLCDNDKYLWGTLITNDLKEVTCKRCIFLAAKVRKEPIVI